jgi:RNA polymerase sigma-70 factor, ECF subfamily
MMNDDTDLLQRCRSGDGPAWDELFDRYYPVAFRFVFQLSADFSREDTEEICQEAFVAVVRGLASFDGRSAFQTWLLRIASNKAFDFRSRVVAAKRGGGVTPVSLDATPEEGGAAFEPASQSPSPDAALVLSENAALMRRCLDQVGDPCREIIELRYYGDLSYDEIASALALNVKTVSSRLSKCLDRLGEIARKVFHAGRAPGFPV